MKRREYTKGFSYVWDCFGHTSSMGLGSRGSKSRAQDEWDKALKKYQTDDDAFSKMVSDSLRRQTRKKMKARRLGEFAEPFQHVERYIKNARWEDDEDEAEVIEQSTMGKMFDRSWAD